MNENHTRGPMAMTKEEIAEMEKEEREHAAGSREMRKKRIMKKMADRRTAGKNHNGGM